MPAIRRLRRTDGVVAVEPEEDEDGASSSSSFGGSRYSGVSLGSEVGEDSLLSEATTT